MFYIALAVIGAILVFVLLSLAKLLSRDINLDVYLKSMPLLSMDNIRLELKANNPQQSSRSYSSFYLVAKQDKKMVPFAKLSEATLNKNVSVRNDEKSHDVYLSFPSHKESAVVLSFALLQEGYDWKGKEVYLSPTNEKGIRSYAKINLSDTSFQRVVFKKKRMKLELKA